jgi:glycosyltransferase involved in cell wall biosynthesis
MSRTGPHFPVPSPAPGPDRADAATPELSVVVPCYNEAEGLAELYRRLTNTCEAVGLHYELVLVDDGSNDQTWERMATLAAQDPRLVLVKLSRNHGHQLALTAGLHVCRGQRVLILDADLQDPPELLPQMLTLMDQGIDVVYGCRRRRAGESAFKRLTAKLFYRLIERLTEVPIPRDVGDFRLISRRALNVFLTMPERHPFIRGMISWIGFRQEPLLYDRHPRFAGTTKYSLRKMVRFALDAIVMFSTKPLALAGWLGAVAGLAGAGLLLAALASWRLALAAWATMLLLGSAQLITLSIFGAYLGRLFEQAKGRPLFIIETIVRADAPTPAPSPSPRA